MLQQSYVYQQPYEQFQYEQQPPSKPKTKKIILTLLLILPILFLLSIFILFIFFLHSQSHQDSTSQIQNAITVTNQLKYDLSLPLLKSIKLLAGANCLSGDKELLLGQFPGVDEGCICKDGQQWVQKDCTSNSGTCKKGNGIKKTDYNVIYNQKKLCYTELNSENYKYASSSKDCESESILNKYCNSGVCVSDLNNCPLTNGFITQRSTTTDSLELNEDTLYINFANTMKNQPLIKLQLAYDSYCLDQITFPELKSSTNYLLLNKQYSGCDEYANYQKQENSKVIYDRDNLFSLTYQQTLLDNSIPYNDDAKSPYYKDYIVSHETEDKWHLYQIFRPKVGTDGLCSNNKGFDNVKHVQTISNNILKPLLIFSIIGLSFSILGILVWIALITLSYISEPSKKHTKQLSQLVKLLHIIAILLSVLIIIIFIYFISSMGDEKDGVNETLKGFNQAVSKNCYVDTKGFKDAIHVVQAFSGFIIDTAYPFIITFFILALMYLVIFSVLSLICLMSGESPFLPPYGKYKQ